MNTYKFRVYSYNDSHYLPTFNGLDFLTSNDDVFFYPVTEFVNHPEFRVDLYIADDAENNEVYYNDLVRYDSKVYSTNRMTSENIINNGVKIGDINDVNC